MSSKNKRIGAYNSRPLSPQSQNIVIKTTSKESFMGKRSEPLRSTDIPGNKNIEKKKSLKGMLS